MIGLEHYLTLAAMLFVLSIAGIIVNRRNLILLLMCVELMLLAVNFNFIAFSRYLGDETGQVFVFFILTVAAAEPAKCASQERRTTQSWRDRCKLEMPSRSTTLAIAPLSQKRPSS